MGEKDATMKKLVAATALVVAVSPLASCSGNGVSHGKNCTSLVGQKVTGAEQASKACEDVTSGTGDFGCTTTSTVRVYWANTDRATYAGVTGGTWHQGAKNVADHMDAIRKLAGC